MEPYGEVVWDGTRDTQRQKSQQRTPDEFEAQLVKKEVRCSPRKLHPTSKESTEVIDTRERWRRENTPIATSGLPRGEYAKT
jgi:hypothetical protein